VQSDWLKEHASNDVPAGYLMPVAYLWTRTVTCKNPSCCATIPLVRHTWLCKKANRYVAMKIVAPKGEKQVRFQVEEASSEKGFGFDPSVGSTAGNATCSFCTNVADSEYVQREGIGGRIGMQMMAVVCSRPGYKGKVYLAVDSATLETVRNANIRERIEMVASPRRGGDAVRRAGHGRRSRA
jgi:putative DNA methylase